MKWCSQKLVISKQTRYACSIQLEEVVIMTGGYYTLQLVTVYNKEGWVEDLTSLNQGRRSHGCGHYVNTENKLVCNLEFTKYPIVILNI